MVTFVIRNNAGFRRYAQQNYKYFLSLNSPDIKITIRKDNVLIHIDAYYCVICNDLKHLQRKGHLEANKKAFNWLNKYCVL